MIYKQDYGFVPRLGRTPTNITIRIENDNMSSLIAGIANNCDIEAVGYKIGDYFEGHSTHTITPDTSTSGSDTPVNVKFTYWLADLDTYYGGYDLNALVSDHHIAILVDTHINKRWKDSTDTLTGYEASRLHQFLKGSDCLNNIKADLNYILGSNTADDHLVKHQKCYSTYDSTKPTTPWNYAYTTGSGETISALTEMDIYGTSIWSGRPSIYTGGSSPVLVDNAYQQGETCRQLEIFREYRFNEIFGDHTIWLRSLSSASRACNASRYGYAHNGVFTYSGGAVGLVLFN